MAYSSQQLKAFGLTKQPTRSKKSSSKSSTTTSKSSGGGAAGGGGGSFGSSTSSKFVGPINFSSETIAKASEALNSGKSAYERAKDVLAAYGRGSSSSSSSSAPTVAESFAAPTFEETPSYEDLYGEEVDEEAVQRRIMRQFQGQINATNQVYDTLLNEARLQGQGRLGSQRAIAARSGLLGSDFGASQKAAVEGYNTDINRGIQAERSAAIGAIMGQMRSAVQAELERKNAARRSGAEDYLNYLATAKSSRENNLNLAASALLMQGLDPRTLDPSELAAIGNEAGLSSNDIINRYLMLQAEQAAAASDGSFTLSEGAARYDAQGNLIASRPKTYAPGSGSGAGGGISLTADARRTLLGSGWSEGDIAAIESDARSYGLEAVIAQAQANGATSEQIAALRSGYNAGRSGQWLTKEFFSAQYGSQLDELAKDAGYTSGLFGRGANTEDFLDDLIGRVEAYRKTGMTDDEIFELMQ